MTVSQFIYKYLNDIAKTYPNNAPDAKELPIIVYSIDSTETNKTISGKIAYSENFVTITVYSDEYNKAQALAVQVIDTLSCSKELNIMGATFTSKSNDYDNEPVDRYSVALEFSIFER